jgi:hypothetical protein
MKRKYRSYNGDGGGVSLGCFFSILLFNLILGGWSVSFLLTTLVAKTIPFWGACIIGLFAGEVTVPVAVIVWLLKSFGVF